MPGYRGHLVGGVAAFGITVYALRSLNPSVLTMSEWFVCALAGSLFPDIDIKSKGQKLFYPPFFAGSILMFFRGYVELVAIMGILALVPMIVRHRGLFHRLWFVILFPCSLVGIATTFFPMYNRFLLLDALFFIVGAISHLWLDLGFRRMIRWR